LRLAGVDKNCERERAICFALKHTYGLRDVVFKNANVFGTQRGDEVPVSIDRREQCVHEIGFDTHYIRVLIRIAARRFGWRRFDDGRPLCLRSPCIGPVEIQPFGRVLLRRRRRVRGMLQNRTFRGENISSHDDGGC